jgi:pilus assembly protein CpaB
VADKPDLNAALHRAADRKARRTGLRAAVFLAIALVAAVGSAVLLTRYMDARTAAVRVPTETVMVAAIDLPVGAEIRAEHLRAVAWPTASRPEGSFSAGKDLEGKVVRVRVYKGEPVLQTKLTGSESGGGLSALLPAGMRAMAVKVNEVVGVAGFVQPGDSVDVIVTLRPELGQSVTASKVILQNIKVLAVGKELDHGGKGSEKVVPATVATLMVDAEQSERLALAATQGKILLTLRGGADEGLVATKGVNSSSLLSAAEAHAPEPRPPERRRVARREPPPPPQSGEVVEILRGDLFERRDFNKGGK